jgi:predicted Rossmann fold nucleotide-binding protein DprA/Smf involved in DNA uptake
VGGRVLDALGWEPTTLDGLAGATGCHPGELSLALARLERDGWVIARAGWWERTVNPAEAAT